MNRFAASVATLAIATLWIAGSAVFSVPNAPAAAPPSTVPPTDGPAVGPPTTRALPTVGIITAPSTVASTGLPVAPTAPPLAEVLFASVDELVVGWNAESALTASAARIEPVDLVATQLRLVVGVGPAGADVFGGQLGDAGLLGGSVTSTGVDGVVVVVDPFGASAAQIVVTFGNLVVPDEIWGDVIVSYTELIGAPPGDTAYFSGATHDVVVAAIAGDAGSRRVSIAVAPLTDEPTAVANAELLRSAVVAATQLTR